MCASTLLNLYISETIRSIANIYRSNLKYDWDRGKVVLGFGADWIRILIFIVTESPLITWKETLKMFPFFLGVFYPSAILCILAGNKTSLMRSNFGQILPPSAARRPSF